MVKVRIIVRGMKENFSMEVCKECSTERIVYCYFLRHNMWLYCLNNVGDDFHILSTNHLRKQKNPMCLYGGVYKFKMVKQLTLLGYSYEDGTVTLELIALGAHENFYRDVKVIYKIAILMTDT